MTHQDANQLKDDYLFLIGQKGNDIPYTISDILVVPVNETDKKGNTFHNGDYIVKVAFDLDGTFLTDDISLYTDRKPDKS